MALAAASGHWTTSQNRWEIARYVAGGGGGVQSQRRFITIKANISRVQVVVHECNVRNMDFNAKNFRYTSMAFGDFAREVRDGARFYLRALSADAPANQPANLARDFPSLAADFRLPEALNMCSENMHSSVLRVSGQVSLPESSPHFPHDVDAPISLVALCLGSPLLCCDRAVCNCHLGGHHLPHGPHRLDSIADLTH